MYLPVPKQMAVLLEQKGNLPQWMIKLHQTSSGLYSSCSNVQVRMLKVRPPFFTLSKYDMLQLVAFAKFDVSQDTSCSPTFRIKVVALDFLDGQAFESPEKLKP